jgi:hypothetical protein
MATPHVSGAAALVLSMCNALDPAGLKSVLLGNTESVPSLAGKTVTGGRLNVFNAVSNCDGTPLTPDFSITATPQSQTVKRGGSASYTVTVTASGGFQRGSLGLSGQATG